MTLDNKVNFIHPVTNDLLWTNVKLDFHNAHKFLLGAHIRQKRRQKMNSQMSIGKIYMRTSVTKFCYLMKVYVSTVSKLSRCR